jgi:hypothetical protein
MKDYVPPSQPERLRRKNADAPKKGKSSFFHFCDDARAVVRADFPYYDRKQLSKELSDRWSALKADDSRRVELAKYMNLAERDSLKYKEDMGRYTAPKKTAVIEEEPMVVRERSERRETRDSSKSAYLLFCEGQRAHVKKSNPGLRGDEITRKLSKAWKNLADDQKQLYRDRV